MSTVVDFHSHILPGIDDGSASTEASIAMLQMAAAQGVRHVIATPHFYPHGDSLDQFLRRRAEAETLLREEMAKHPGLPQIRLGAEISFFSGISDSGMLSELAIVGTKCILLEMPRMPWKDSVYREMEAIQAKQGLTPIIAHVDRYIRPFKTNRVPERLQELPVLVQANASFFLNKVTARMALRMLREDKIQLLGSDCHNLHTRAPNLGPAVQVIRDRLGTEILERIQAYEQEVLTLTSDEK